MGITRKSPWRAIAGGKTSNHATDIEAIDAALARGGGQVLGATYDITPYRPAPAPAPVRVSGAVTMRGAR